MSSVALFRPRHDRAFFVRIFTGLLLGGAVTLFLFWVMQYLIATADRSLDDAERGALVDFVRVKRAEVVERRQIKPRKPPPPKTPPPQPPAPKLDKMQAKAEKIAIREVPVETDIKLSSGGFSLGVGEGDYLPIVKVAPIYPQRALNRGTQGECVVEFTVTRSGTTRDARPVEGRCHSAFKKASVEAALKFKYKPRVVDGQAIEVPGVRNKFTYRLED
ncbi:MAG: energy transducer TonB [Gammaproteobacteria bacterium]